MGQNQASPVEGWGWVGQNQASPVEGWGWVGQNQASPVEGWGWVGQNQALYKHHRLYVGKGDNWTIGLKRDSTMDFLKRKGC